MKLTIANVSARVTQKRLRAVVAAIAKQVTRHFKPEWGIGATLNAIALPIGQKKAPINKGADAVIYIGDSWKDPYTGAAGSYGYHSFNNKRMPYGFIYLDICDRSPEPWTTALSHEVLELLADPDTVLAVSGPKPKHQSTTVFYDFEVCDPTEGDHYHIDGVAVSNFVGKRYFTMSGGSGKTNYLGLPLRPLGVRPNGYLQYEQGSRGTQVWGPSVTDAQKRTKKKLEAVRRNGRRLGRLTGS
jgi:hypothetical protein